MRNARKTSIGRRGAWLLALACIVTLAFSLILPLSADVEKACAKNDQPALQASQITEQAQGDAGSVTTVKKKRLSKKKMTMTMAGGNSTVLGVKKASSKVKWASSNKRVVKVKPTGKHTAKVTALKPGKATVTAKVGKKKLTCKITVTGMLSARSITLTPFQTAKLHLKGAKAAMWKASNEKVAQVSKGTITPLGNGATTVTCVDKKGYKYTCVITVKCPNISCAMDATSKLNTFFVKRFTLVNKSGSAIALDSDLINHYPYGINGSEHFLYGCTEKGYFDESPLTVANGQSATFMGTSNEDTPLTSIGFFGIRFSVKGTQYHAVFHNAGGMTACWRS